MYEQEGLPQEFLGYYSSMSGQVVNQLHFPALDVTRFGESAYYRVTKKATKV